MNKCYTNLKPTIFLTSIYLFSFIIAWYFYGDITLKLIVISRTFFIALSVFITGFILIYVFIINQYVFKVFWDERRIILKYLCCKKKTYWWNSISAIYYCPKFGVVHFIIATDDGEFYSLPDVSDKLLSALKKYAKVKIENIKHPMEVLPTLWERQKNARKSRKKLSKRR